MDERTPLIQAHAVADSLANRERIDLPRGRSDTDTQPTATAVEHCDSRSVIDSAGAREDPDGDSSVDSSGITRYRSCSANASTNFSRQSQSESGTARQSRADTLTDTVSDSYQPSPSASASPSGTCTASPSASGEAIRAYDHVHDNAHGRFGDGDEATSEYRETLALADEATLLQACVFIEDALQYRSIHHRVDGHSLKLYRVYYSSYVQWLLYGVIFVLHMLAFVENPSSLTWTSDIRTRPQPLYLPCGATESLELVCLLLLAADLVAKAYFKGLTFYLHEPWLLAYTLLIAVSLLDWTVSVSLLCVETVRIRRMLRPFFLLQNSTLMKKTVKSLKRSMPQILSVLLLLLLHLFFFAIFGLLLFSTADGSSTDDLTKKSTGVKPSERIDRYFSSLEDTFINLIILLTTANHPDVAIPAYSANRLYIIYFILFLIIGLYCLMTMLTAVVYNQFRGYFTSSLQASLFKQRLAVRAAYEVLRRTMTAHLTIRSQLLPLGHGVSVGVMKQVVHAAQIRKVYRRRLMQELESFEGSVLNCGQFQKLFAVFHTVIPTVSPAMREVSRPLRPLQAICAHRYFSHFGCAVSCLNALCITLELGIELHRLRISTHTYLSVFNLIFVSYYLLEQTLRIWALGWRLYMSRAGNIFDGSITITLVIVEIVCLLYYGLPYGRTGSQVKEQGVSLWNLVRVINMLIMVRLLHIVVHIKAMFIVASTFVDLVKNLKPFAGIMVVLYYSYALLGMQLFSGSIEYNTDNNTNSSMSFECGSYQQLQYWPNNFDDFAASLVVLWDVMVVNNWYVFLHAYSNQVSRWSQLYFIGWWLLSVVISLSLFTSIILENFIMRWDRVHEATQQTASLHESYRAESMTVHDVFRSVICEPSEEYIEAELRQHTFYRFEGCHRSLATTNTAQ